MAIDVSQDWVGLFCAFQVTPPSLECSSCPEKPAAQPLLPSKKRTVASDHSAASVLMVCQVFPPSVVRNIVPDQPTDQPRSLSRKKMDSSAIVVPLFCLVQVRPASAEWSRAPSNPLVHAWLPKV